MGKLLKETVEQRVFVEEKNCGQHEANVVTFLWTIYVPQIGKKKKKSLTNKPKDVTLTPWPHMEKEENQFPQVFL